MAHGGGNPQGVVRQLLSTQFRVEHAFKNRINRELQFKRDKMQILDKVLHAKHIVAAAEDEGAEGHPVSNTGPLQRSSSTAKHSQKGGPAAGAAPLLARSGSWTAGLGAACLSRGDPFTSVRPQGTARTRLGSSMPLSWHPVAHPGASMAYGSTLLPASPGAGSSRGQSYETWPTKSPREAAARSELRDVLARLDAERSLLGCEGAGAAAEPAEPTEEYLQLKLMANNVEQEVEALGHTQESQTTAMTERLGDMIALLGPRYKTVNKAMIWERAEKGETSSFQRRLQKAKESGAVPKDIVAMATRQDAGSRMEAIGPDVDGTARREWLQARRRTFTANVPLEVALEGLGGAAAFVTLPMRPVAP